MRLTFRRRRGSGAVAALAVAVLSGGQLTAQAPGGYAFENVTVIPMAGGERLLAGQTVLVRDGEIVAIGPAAEIAVPSAAVRIPGEGRYLAPGISEMIARLPAQDDPLRVIVLGEALNLYLANGVTTIRSVDGSPYQLELREAIATGAVLGPRLFVGSPILDAATAGGRAAAEGKAREYAAAGYDFLTVGPDLPATAWERLLEVAAELGLSLHGAAPEGVPLTSAIETLASLYPLPSALAELATEAAETDLYVTPAQYLAHHQYGWNHVLGGWVAATDVVDLDEMGYVPQTVREDWRVAAWNRWDVPTINPESARNHVDERRALVRALHDSGVPFLMGSDAQELFNVPGFSIHRELPLLVEAGMSPYEVLQAGTSAVARYVDEELGREAEFGTIAVGRDADLLLLESNPLDSVAALARPAGVMVRGRWLSRQDLDDELEEIAERHKDYDPD